MSDGGLADGRYVGGPPFVTMCSFAPLRVDTFNDHARQQNPSPAMALFLRHARRDSGAPIGKTISMGAQESGLTGSRNGVSLWK